MVEYIERKVILLALQREVEDLAEVGSVDGLAAMMMAKSFVETAPASDVVSRGALEQIMWERDLAIQQLREDYGVGLGEKKSADVVEVKRGRWEKNKAIGGNYKQCSCCKYDFARLYPDNFCPNCGARMEM